jgi:hypothetical protein
MPYADPRLAQWGESEWAMGRPGRCVRGWRWDFFQAPAAPPSGHEPGSACSVKCHHMLTQGPGHGDWNHDLPHVGMPGVVKLRPIGRLVG